MHQNCFVLISHRIDDSFLKYISFLKKEANGIMDFVILYDCANHEIKKSDFPEYTFHFFNSSKLNQFFHFGNKSLPNPLVALLDMIKERPYQHYLLMENDIVLSGHFSSFLSKISESNCDYIHIATDTLGRPDAHWPIKFIHNSSFSNIYFSWSQLFYISYKYLKDIDLFMKDNNSFYYEFLLPTMAYNNGYSIKQFENYGYNFQLSWGPSEVFEYKYKYERMHNTFYHPVKDSRLISIL